jgi:hypothetical protein
MSPKHRPAEMVSKVELALNMRYVRQVISVRSLPSGQLRQLIAFRPLPQVIASGHRARYSRR